MDRDELTTRATTFGIRVLHLVDALPAKRSANAIANQLARSATSIGANYRAARRSRSKKEFRAKLCIVVEEADETEHWLRVIVEAELIDQQRLAGLLEEAEALVKIFARMRKTAFDD